MSKLLQMYLRALETHPLRTSACSTGTMMAAGDCICQLLIERTKNYDFNRTGRFLGFGLFLGGPMFRVWYKTIDKVFRNQKYAPAKMVLADQGCFAPVFLPFFLGTMGFMRGETMDEFKTQIKKDYGPVMSANYKVWPAVQICNFMFVPLQHRVLVVNLVSVFWNTYLAWFAETKNKKSLHEVTHETDSETNQTMSIPEGDSSTGTAINESIIS